MNNKDKLKQAERLINEVIDSTDNEKLASVLETAAGYLQGAASAIDDDEPEHITFDGFARGGRMTEVIE